MQNIRDYYLAPSGDGPQAGQWADKPHRLVYDLCRAVAAMRRAFRPLVDAGALEPGDHGNDRLLRVTDAELTLACQAYNDALSVFRDVHLDTMTRHEWTFGEQSS
jgi:hypothetical protein